MNQRAGAGNAGLSGRREDSGHDAVYRLIEIGIIKNDVRRLPAELQRDVLDAARGELVDVFAGSVAAGERDFGNIGMRDQRFADFTAISRDDVDHARRKAGFLKQLAKRKRRDRRIFGWFPHRRIAGGQAPERVSMRQEASGEFHGVMAATTPSGSSRVKLNTPGLSIGITRPSILSARPPK